MSWVLFSPVYSLNLLSETNALDLDDSFGVFIKRLVQEGIKSSGLILNFLILYRMVSLVIWRILAALDLFPLAFLRAFIKSFFSIS